MRLKYYIKMAFLHLINCLILTYAPLFIIFKNTSLADYGWKVCLFSGLGYIGTSMIKMVLFASLVPIYESGFELHVELIKALIGFLDILAMKYIYEWNSTRVGDK